MKVRKTTIEGVLIIDPRRFNDERGCFLESFRRDILEEAGVEFEFVQANTSRSKKNVLRGLHYQTLKPQGKLVSVSNGSVFDVAVDIREGSSTYGQYFGVELNDENRRQLWIPPGLAHGFCTLSDTADLHYLCTDYYDPGGEGGILWSDPMLGIEWPVKTPLVSKKDAMLPLFSARTGCE